MTPPSLSLTTLFLFSLFHVSLSVSPTTYIYGGCSHIKYSQNSVYYSSLNSLLTSLVNSASNSPFSKLTLTSPAAISGVYQCRGDLPESACSACIRNSVSQLGSICVNSVGGVIQLDGCFFKYDNATFLGVEDKTVVLKRCGGGGGGDSGELVSRRDQVLGYLASLSESYYRVGESGGVRGVGQCVGDLSVGECQDCLVYAMQRFKTDCGGTGASGDLFLGKCYVRVTVGAHGSGWYGSNAGSSQDDEIEKTLAILVGLIAGIALLVIFFAFLRKLCDGKDGK